MVLNVSSMSVTFIPVSPQPHTESAQASQASCAHSFWALQSIAAGRQNHTLSCSSQVVASWLTSRCLWTQMNWARHSCLRVSTIKVETSVPPQAFPSLYTCWEPSSSSNKSGSLNCHCLAGEPPYLIPTPAALYICTVGPVVIRTGEEKGRQGGEICITSQIQIQIYFSFFLLRGA